MTTNYIAALARAAPQLGAPVVATIDVHPEIARLVDAGLLSGRPPRHVLRHLTALLCPEGSTQP